MKTLVHNHSGRPIHLSQPGSAAVHEIRTLLPGINAVNAETWGAAKAHQSVQRLIDAELLTEVQAKGEKAATEAKLPASDKDALKLVAETVDRELLESWAKGEKREKLKRALASQLDKIKPGDGGEEAKTE